ncbi:transcriptional regulator, LacI family [Anaerocolumna jejuensis DSM 15929]|uniref:Transcriptional regulator, LacI family n=1 Tax=Anaerocolumna jejuensis DSM 15929 TaxID=1121322 RepID=A0A1M7CFT7_9FIRM|nr:LacI family DNA-binding transcriptional regulator [Anaerocolumna jejuensis]SHL65759.1 transcriptional regulator, LacI family [Anaerocolumna jejuensis DSM 15929]
MSTIRDVAKLANVSTATVSRVLNNDSKYKMTTETKNRVLDAVTTLDYKVQTRTSKKKIITASQDTTRIKIGCILSVTKKKYNDPYFMAILSGVEKLLFSKGYDISFIRTGPELEDHNCLTSTFQEYISGLILMEPLNKEVYNYIRKHVPHIVGIDTQRTDIDNVGYDHYQIADAATKHLISKGHTKIGFIGGTLGAQQIKQSQRFQGYYLAMHSAGLEVNDQWTINCQWDEELCANKVDYLCKTQNYPTAFFVASDLMAMAAMNSFYVNNISVPKDVAIIGMSDIEISRFSNPPLTTIHVPMEEIGMVAANLLLERIHGYDLLPQKVILPTSLVLRSST